jgi:small subunit ribosomal protein S9
MSKVIHTSGSRKRAIARATLTAGSGNVTINSVSIEQWGNALTRARVHEPIVLAGDGAKKHDIRVVAFGGGNASQADAIRLAIGRALSQGNEKLRTDLLSYDRTLLVADVRRKEPAKPNSHGQARSKTQKSYR